MSLFGAQSQPAQSSGLFGSTTANKPNLFGTFGSTTTTGTQQGGGGLFGSTQPQQNTGGSNLFRSNVTSQPQQTGGLLGSLTTQNQPQSGGGLFGSSTQLQQPQGSGLFGSLGQSQQQQQPQQQAGGLFGSSLQQKPQGGNFFGGLGQQQQQPQTTTTQQSGSFFGGLGTSAQQQRSGWPLQQPQASQQQQQQQPPQQPQLGQSTTKQQPLGSSLWSPGRAITGVHRTVPMQMEIVRSKWDFMDRGSPFRTYLYNRVGEDSAPFYQPGPADDETKWEEALRKRPDSGYVPVLVRGFLELGRRAQKQKDYLSMMQQRLHEINNCLTDLLSRHDLKITVRIAESRRRHLVLSKRCLALAAKTQVLRNRGYALDEAEEELKKKLTQLERSVFDPSLVGREEEIWARLLAIREQSRRLQAAIEQAGPNTSEQETDELNEDTMRTAKKILENYNAQIQHIQQELEKLNKDFEENQHSRRLEDN